MLSSVSALCQSPTLAASAVLRHQTRHFANRVEAWPSFLAFAPPLQPWQSIWGVDVQRLSQNYTLVSFFSFLVTPRSTTLRPLRSDHICHGFMTACLTSAPRAGHAGSGDCPVHGARSTLYTPSTYYSRRDERSWHSLQERRRNNGSGSAQHRLFFLLWHLNVIETVLSTLSMCLSLDTKVA
jgi:hypothetical protein